MSDSATRWRVPPRLQRWMPALGALAGLGVALFDYAFFVLLDIAMTLNGEDVTWLVSLVYGVSFGAFGFVCGKLWLARDELRDKAAIISAQVTRLETQQAKLLEQEKLAALGRLASGVAHEVRNPLGVIASSASLVAEDLDPNSEAYAANQFITEEVARLNSFVTELLDFARPVSTADTPVSLDEVVALVEELAGPTVVDAGLELTIEGTSDSPTVNADPQVLARALYGMVLNAAQTITETSGSRIVVRIGRSDAEAFVEVSDDGPGVPDDVADKVFEPFFTTRPDGTGLGLAMAQKIAERHGGRVELVERAAGATFRAVFPTSRQAGRSA